MFEIIPSILTNNLSEAKDLIMRCEGVVRRVQIDIVDGVFANNKTIDPANLADLDVFMGLDFHLMVKEPIHWTEKCIRGGADRIIGQVELMNSQKDFVEDVQYKNLRVGLALDLETPLSIIDPSLYTLVDVILLMSVKAGFGGQDFKVKTLGKIEELNKIRIREKAPFRICVDGGENEEVIDDSYRDGADEIVIGRRLFAGDIEDNIKKLQEAAKIN